ncbi:MAG: nucleoside hydrolase [Anaerolineae bacterium]|jgi:purine nucleosidase|nr:nucleoside hydrolase [Anaerolineae bacterium]MCZ7554388.1 nucleoside hydrolase [Anaerolineales bacterium]
MDKKRIIIDTDPGIDDSLAILLAVASPELQIEGLTVVSGNCTLENGVINALSVLELAGRSDLPVFGGAARPLVQPLLIAPETHGERGIGYARLPYPVAKPSSQHAVEFIIEKVSAHPGEISLVCIGPLTNLALALRLAPQIVEKIPEVIIMGGAIRHEGNTTALAEFNTYCDPHAAHIVFHSGLPITLVPLDVTYQVNFTRMDVQRLLDIPSPVSTFIADATRFYMEFHDEYQKIDGCIINDPLALALTIAPHFVTTEELFVDVDISGGVSMGKTFADFYRISQNPPNMDVALRVQARQFIEFFLERAADLCRMIPE